MKLRIPLIALLSLTALSVSAASAEAPMQVVLDDASRSMLQSAEEQLSQVRQDLKPAYSILFRDAQSGFKGLRRLINLESRLDAAFPHLATSPDLKKWREDYWRQFENDLPRFEYAQMSTLGNIADDLREIRHAIQQPDIQQNMAEVRDNILKAANYPELVNYLETSLNNLKAGKWAGLAIDFAKLSPVKHRLLPSLLSNLEFVEARSTVYWAMNNTVEKANDRKTIFDTDLESLQMAARKGQLDVKPFVAKIKNCIARDLKCEAGRSDIRDLYSERQKRIDELNKKLEVLSWSPWLMP